MALLEYECYLDKNNFYSLSEIKSLYGPSYLINFEKTLVLKNQELFERYLNEDLINVKVNGEEYTVSKTLIKDLINDIGMRHYLFENLDNRLSIGVRIACIDESGLARYIKVSRALLDQALRIMKDEFPDSIKMHIAMIHSFTNYQSFKNKYSLNGESREENYNCIIDNQNISIPINTLTNIFVSESLSEFKDLIENNTLGYSKEIMSYALIDFIEKERILKKYNFDDFIIKRYKNLKGLKIYNFESLNKNNQTNTLRVDGSDLLDGVILPDYLIELMQTSLKRGNSSLETAILCYLELCDTLKYDEDYLITKIKEDESAFTPTEEFVYLMAKVLKELNIRFTVNQNLIIGNTKNYENLTFKYGEFMVSIDSLDDINKSDLTSVRIGDKLFCIRSINRVKTSQDKFDELVDKIYKEYLMRQKRELDFESNLEEYRKTYMNFEVSKDERIKTLLKAIARKDLRGVDTISYITRIFNKMFDKNDGITITFIGNSSLGREYIPTPLTIVTVQDEDKYIYFEVDPKSEFLVKKVSLTELQNLFDMGFYCFISSDTSIPGMEKKSEYIRNA